jgi:hypothetical protein
MALALLLMLILVTTFFCPLLLPWRKSGLYIWLAIWFGSWLVFYGLSQYQSSHYSKGSYSTFFALVIALFSVGSFIRATSRGIVAWFRRRREQPLNPPASGT